MRRHIIKETFIYYFKMVLHIRDIFHLFQALRQSILQLLTPIAMTHTIVFVASIADVWNSKKLAEKDLETNSKPPSFLTVTNEQLKVIKLVLDIKVRDDE